MIKDIVKSLKPSSTLKINEICKSLEKDGKIKSKLIKLDLKKGVIRVDHTILNEVRDIMNKNESLRIKTIRTRGTLKALEKE